MSLRRVVVTGVGMVTPLGCGVERSWGRLIEGQSAFLQPIGKSLAFEVLHDEKVNAVVLANVVKRTDVRMIQA